MNRRALEERPRYDLSGMSGGRGEESTGALTARLTWSAVLSLSDPRELVF